MGEIGNEGKLGRKGNNMHINRKTIKNLRMKKSGVRKLQIKTYICVALLLAMAVIGMSGCSGTKLAENFDEDKVKEAAQKAVDCLVAGEYEDCVAMMSQEMQAALPAETLAASTEAVKEQAGEFQEYKSITVVGQQDSEGTNYAVAVLVVKFEKGNITYTVNFDTEMQIIGLWMK